MLSHFCLFLLLAVNLLNKVSCNLSFSTHQPNQSSSHGLPGQSSPPIPLSLQQSQGQPLVQGQQQLTCDRKNLNTCLDNFTNGLLANGGASLFVFNETTFAETCLQLPNVKNCIAEKGRNCLEHDLIYFKGTLESVNYICNVNRPGYYKLQDCFNDLTKYYAYHTNLIGCNNDLTATFKPDFNITGQVCKQNNGMYSCHVNASQLCDSTEFMINYYKLFNDPVYKLIYQCNLNYSNWNTTQVYSECNFQKSYKCLENQTTFLNTLKVIEMIFNGTKVSSFCNSVVDTKMCFVKEAKCLENESVILSTFSKANSYLCNETKTEYDKLIKCYETNNSFFNSCLAIPSADCAGINAVHKCLVDSSKKLCGDGTFIQNYVYDILQPTFQIFNCNLNLQKISFTNAKDGGKLGSQGVPVYVLLFFTIFSVKFV